MFKKRIRQVLSITMVLFLVFGLYGNTKVKAEGESAVYQGMTFNKTTQTITAYDDSVGGKEATIPSEIDGVIVKHIGDNAFRNKSITKLILPSTLVSIGKEAFQSTWIKQLSIPDSVTEIGENAFGYNMDMETLKLPNQLKKINKSVFSGCYSLKELTIPDSVIEIGDDAFSGNYRCIKLNLSANLKKIGSYAFAGNQIVDVILPDSVTEVGALAFSAADTWVMNITNVNINSQKTLKLSKNMKTVSKDAFRGAYIDEVIIPEGVEKIEKGAFQANHLIDVKLPNSIKEIDPSAFTQQLIFFGYWDIRRDDYAYILETGHYLNKLNLSEYELDNIRGVELDDFKNMILLGKGAVLYKKHLRGDILLEGTLTTDPHSSAPFGYYVKYYDIDNQPLCAYVSRAGISNFLADTGRIPEAPVVEGYKFIKWDKDLTDVTEDLDVYPIYEKLNKVVFLDKDGKQLKSEYVETGEDATAPTAPIEDGYRYIGWDKAYTNVQGDITIQAKYVKTWKVNFYDKEKKQLGETQIIDDQGKAIQPKLKEITGYTFTGWDKAFDKVTSDLNIYAKYEKKSYQVTFKDREGNTLKTEQVKYGEDATAPKAPTEEGYRYIGWDKDYTKVEEDLVVQAKYVKTWKVNFYDQEKKQLGETQLIDDQGKAIAPKTKEVTGYTFTGWDQTFDKVTSDLNIYAKYAKKQYQVLFVDYDDRLLKEDTVKYQENATAPGKPTREGYRFIGWDKEYNNITENMIVKAKYEKVIVGKEKPNKKEEDKKQDPKKDIDTSDQSNTILFLVLLMISGGYLVIRKRSKE